MSTPAADYLGPHFDNGHSADGHSVKNTVANTEIIHTDVLIIGAGLAGLSTALPLPKSLNIIVLSKADLQACSSHYAQGGIAASLDKDDSVNDHVTDTLIAGAGLCAPENTASILSQGQQAVHWLCTQGVPFTQIPLSNSIGAPAISSTLNTNELHLTKEGGHGCRRVAHADDATGRHIMQALIVKARLATNITILPYHEALTLLTEPSFNNSLNSYSKDRQCQGAIIFDHNTQQQLTIHSRAVVMASGGLGQLFARASAPNVCVGDGVMMAWQAGCRLANLEFVQFHPTGLAVADSSFLISEALRGEGGHLYCPLTGERFMLDIDERAELAPRDIVARAIAAQIEKNGLGYVHLNISHLPAPFIKQHFPQIYQTLLALGIDIATDPIPVAPTAHYSCGGIVTCSDGLSDVQGLYAAGEVAYTGLHGANRLASNSLLECVAVGRNIAAHLPYYLKDDRWSLPIVASSQFIKLPTYKLIDNTNSTIRKNSIQATDIKSISAELKNLMSSHLGITRHARKLQQALIKVSHWQKILNSSANKKTENTNVDDLPIKDSSATLNDLSYFQLMRQLQLATLILHSASQRQESRGGHYRQDYPSLANKPLVSIIEPVQVDTPVDEYVSYKLEAINKANSKLAAMI